MFGNLEVQAGQAQHIERRRDRRLPCGDSGTLQVLRPFSPTLSHIQIVDISKGGLKVACVRSLEQGTIVQVQLRTTIATGEVRHCTRSGKRFHIGIKFGEVIER